MTDLQRTLVLVKPDGVRRGNVGEVLHRIEAKGYRLVAVELRTAMRAAITELVARAQAAGAVRDDVSPADTAMLFAGIAQITAVAGGDPAIRDRYVAVMLDGLRPSAATPLPGKPMQYRDIDRILQKRARKG